MLVPFHTSFGVTHPLGLPRPIDVDNVFGARRSFFAQNLMPVPTGCLAHFDGAVYRPYAKRLAAWLAAAEFGWEGPVELGDPPRYCLLREGAPTSISEDLQDEIPEPPAVRLEALLNHFDRNHPKVPTLQLLDLLTLIAEDLGPKRFAAVTAGRAWVHDYLR